MQRAILVGACSGIILSVAPASASAGAGQASPPRFVLTDLGTLPGDAFSEAHAINNAGMVAGTSSGPPSFYAHAVAWIDGEIVDITGLGFSGAAANAISANGVVVGFTDEFSLNAYSWLNGSLFMLSIPNFCCSEATSINDNGTIVGRVAIDGGGTPNSAATWIHGAFIPLESLGFGYDIPYDVNNDGIAVGVTSDGQVYLPAVWNGLSISTLPTLGGFFSEATAINDAGLVVGSSEPPMGVSRAVAWAEGEIVELPRPEGVVYAWAEDVNAEGWIVGAWAPSGSPGRAALWIDGEFHDLETLVVNGPASLGPAKAINDLGQIVGVADIDGSPRAVLLTPTPSADLDGDGHVDGADVGLMLAAWGKCGGQEGCLADLSGDGVVDGSDLGLLLGQWK